MQNYEGLHCVKINHILNVKLYKVNKRLRHIITKYVYKSDRFMAEQVYILISGVFIALWSISSVSVLVKFVFKKWINEWLKKQTEKSKVLFKQQIDRQDRVFDIRINREFDCYNVFQNQNGCVVIVIEESLDSLIIEDSVQFYFARTELQKILKEFIDNMESNRAYIDTDLLGNIGQIRRQLELLLQCCPESTDFSNISKMIYLNYVLNLIKEIGAFNRKLKEYIFDISNTN